MQKANALYIHVPFCATKCYYCDFNTYTFHKDQAEAFIDALAVEMALYASQACSLKTVFLGGGTPSILSPSALERLFSDIRSNFRLHSDAEVTVECNPGTVDPEKLDVFRRVGVNRLSFGVQAMDDETLRSLGRIHKVKHVLHSYYLAREVGFDNINLDLIFALPNQTLHHWRYTLRETIVLQPDHISAYNLTLEEGTPFYEWHQAGKLKKASNDLEAAMYETTIETLTGAGFGHYEISNFAKPGRTAKHNLVYWNNEPYVGLGPGACGYVNGVRYTNVRSVPGYVRSLAQGETPVAETEQLTGRDEKAETLILGLRKREGVCHEAYQSRFGEPIDAAFRDVVRKWLNLELLTWQGNNLRLTDAGLMVANEVFMSFL